MHVRKCVSGCGSGRETEARTHTQTCKALGSGASTRRQAVPSKVVSVQDMKCHKNRARKREREGLTEITFVLGGSRYLTGCSILLLLVLLPTRPKSIFTKNDHVKDAC
jgi:hypothetical protein